MVPHPHRRSRWAEVEMCSFHSWAQGLKFLWSESMMPVRDIEQQQASEVFFPRGNQLILVPNNEPHLLGFIFFFCVNNQDQERKLETRLFRRRNKITKAPGAAHWASGRVVTQSMDCRWSGYVVKISQGRSRMTNHPTWMAYLGLDFMRKSTVRVVLLWGHHEAVAPLNQGIQKAALHIWPEGAKEAISCIFSTKREQRSICFIGFQCFMMFHVFCCIIWRRVWDSWVLISM